MTDKQITTAPQQTALDQSTDAYQRLFNFLSQFEPETRDLALNDLQTVFDTTAHALAHADEQQRIADSLTGVVEDARMQIYLMAQKVDQEKDRAADMRELGLAVAIAEYMGADPHYAKPILEAMMGIEEEYWIDETLIDDLRASVQRIQADMQDADMCDAWLESDAS